MDHHLNPGFGRAIQGLGEGGVQVCAGAERLAVGALHHDQRYGPIAFRDHRRQVAQVPRRARRYAIGKLGQARRTRQVAVLDPLSYLHH